MPPNWLLHYFLVAWFYRLYDIVVAPSKNPSFILIIFIFVVHGLVFYNIQLISMIYIIIPKRSCFDTALLCWKIIKKRKYKTTKTRMRTTLRLRNGVRTRHHVPSCQNKPHVVLHYDVIGRHVTPAVYKQVRPAPIISGFLRETTGSLVAGRRRDRCYGQQTVPLHAPDPHRAAARPLPCQPRGTASRPLRGGPWSPLQSQGVPVLSLSGPSLSRWPTLSL